MAETFEQTAVEAVAGSEKVPEQATEVTENTPEELAAEKVETEKKKENHDSRRMTKFMQRAFKAEAEAEVLRKQLEQRTQQPDQTSQEPQRDSFSSDADYLKAVRAYDRELVKAELSEQFNARVGATTTEASWTAQRAAAQKAHPDYNDTLDSFVEEVGDVQLPGHIQDALQTSDVGGEILYNLLKDPDEYRRIEALSPIAAVREIGKLEAKVTMKAPKRVSSAAAPIKPVGGGGTVDEDPNKLSDAEWAKRYGGGRWKPKT